MTTTLTRPAAIAAERRPRRRPQRVRRNWAGALGGFVWLAIIVLPLYYIVISSLRDQAGFFTSNPLAPPTHPTLANYWLALQNNFGMYFLNSVTVTLAAVLATMAVSLVAAYALVRNTSAASARTFSFLLLGLAIPSHATIIPLYWMITRMHLYDSLLALILPSIGFAVPITVLILSNFIRDIPKELFESMRVDGAGEWGILVRLVVPLARPALVTVGIYDALHVWNGFLLPLILTQSENRRVLPMALWTFQGENTVDVPATLAAVILSTLPILLLYIFGRRLLLSGLTAGFGK
jgi:raffinose/stachyose/melibiose transport system permease protein